MSGLGVGRTQFLEEACFSEQSQADLEDEAVQSLVLSEQISDLREEHKSGEESRSVASESSESNIR